MPQTKNSKTKKYLYTVHRKNYSSFKEAAVAAIDLSLNTGSPIAISEMSIEGVILGYINVQASGEDA